MAIRSNMRGGSGSGRGDDAHGLNDKVYGYSAATRKAEPLTKEQHNELTAQGKSPDAAYGSKAEYTVDNQSTQPRGTTMGHVRSTYKNARKEGFTPDRARSLALGGGNGFGQGATHPGSTGHGARMTKDAYGKEVR